MMLSSLYQSVVLSFLLFDRQLIFGCNFCRFGFGHKESETFSDALTHVRLPGLNNLDQMYLMALASTVANTQTDFSDKFTDVKQTTSGKLTVQVSGTNIHVAFTLEHLKPLKGISLNVVSRRTFTPRCTYMW